MADQEAGRGKTLLPHLEGRSPLILFLFNAPQPRALVWSSVLRGWPTELRPFGGLR